MKAIFFAGQTPVPPRSGTWILDLSHEPIWTIWLAEVRKFHQHHDRMYFRQVSLRHEISFENDFRVKCLFLVAYVFNDRPMWWLYQIGPYQLTHLTNPEMHQTNIPQCIVGYETVELWDSCDRSLKDIKQTLCIIKLNDCRQQTEAPIHVDVVKWKHFPRYWPFVWELTGQLWNPLTKASYAELWCFLWSAHE